MKKIKNIFILAILSLLPLLVNAQTKVPQLHGKTQLYYWSPSTNGEQWVWQYETLDKYDKKGRKVLEVQIGDTVADSIEVKSIWHYDSIGSEFGEAYSTSNQLIGRDTVLLDRHGNGIRWILEGLDNNRWVINNDWRDSITYNSKGKIVVSKESVYNSVVKFTRENDFAYNANGSLEADTLKRWNGNSWINHYLIDSISYSNYKNNVLLPFSLYQPWDNGSLFIKDSAPLPSSFHYSRWNGSSWQDSERLSFTWDTTGAYKETDQIWKNNKWVNYSQDSQQVDSLGNVIYLSQDTFNGFAWEQVFHSRLNYTYGPNGKIIQLITQYYNLSTNQYQNSEKLVYSDSGTFTSIKHNTFSALNLYPNPATKTLHLQSGEASSEKTDISIYTMQGQEVLHRQISGNELSSGINIPVSNLANGMYILRAVSGSGESRVKFVKE